MNKELTLQQLKDMKSHTVIAKGETAVEDYWDASKEMQINWVAIRGGIHDWAIYYQLADKNWNTEMIIEQGEKMHNETSIKKCVPCDEEAFKMYRH